MKAIVFLFVLMTGLISDAIAASPFVETVRHAKQCVWRVEDQNGKFLGTAFSFNDKGQFMTCDHVIKSRGRYRDSIYISNHTDLSSYGLKSPKGSKHRFKVSIGPTLPEYDAAVLQLDLKAVGMKSTPYLEFESAASLEEGSDIAICAFVTDSYSLPKPFVAKGIVSTIRPQTFDSELNSYVDIAQLDLSISQGTSGGPILNPLTGKVVGIQDGGIFENDNASQTSYAIAVTIDQVIARLKEMNVRFVSR